MPTYEQINVKMIPLPLLLEAEPSEERIRSYLPDSVCFGAFEQSKLLGACVTSSSQGDICEICNLAVWREAQSKGIGSGLLKFVLQELSGQGFRQVVTGTGTFGCQLKFYLRHGFQVDGEIKDFFIDHYDEPVFERGRQHIDMLRLSLNIED